MAAQAIARNRSFDIGVALLLILLDAFLVSGLIRTLSLLPPHRQSDEYIRSERLYYDGIRPYLFREYVWGPGDGTGGVDELLVQVDSFGDRWWVMQDAGGDVVALADLQGAGDTARVVAQWTYDAYGAVLTAEHLHAHAPLHCGHKGLFLERLDEAAIDTNGFEVPRLAPYTDPLVHNRNRSYHPELGRFLQRDPNATAMLLMQSTVFHGRGLTPSCPSFDLQSMMGNGANLTQYLGSCPWDWSDPLGLFLPMSPVDTAMTGAEVGRIAYELVAFYADEQMAMAEWTEDWDLPDDLFDGPVVLTDEDMLAMGLVGDLAVGSTRITSGFRAVRALIRTGGWRFGQVFPTYSAARGAKAASGFGRRAQAHHLIPSAIARRIGVTTNGPAVILGNKHHQVFTTKLNRVLRDLKRLEDRDLIKTATEGRRFIEHELRTIYSSHPEWMNAIGHLLQ